MTNPIECFEKKKDNTRGWLRVIESVCRFVIILSLLIMIGNEGMMNLNIKQSIFVAIIIIIWTIMPILDLVIGEYK